MASLPLLLAAVATVVFIYNLLNFLRRPAKPLPPGPRPWPLVGNLPHLGPAPHRSMAEMAKTYGPLIHLKLGFVDAVVVASASAAVQVLKNNDANFLTRPSTSTAKYFVYDHRDLVFAEGPRWRMLRKISSVYLFSGKALEDFQHIRQEEVSLMTRSLTRAGPNPVNLGQRLNVCVANVLGRVIVGKRLFGDGSGLSDAKADDFKLKVVELMAAIGVFNIGEFVPVLEPLDLQGVAKKLKELHKWFDAFLTVIIKEHEAAAGRGDRGQQADMLSTLISLKDNTDEEGRKLTDTDIKALLLDMFIAGTDTTSSTVEWAIAELIRHPDIMAQVKDELDSVVGHDRQVAEHDLPKLTYLQAMIKENFRVHPSTPLSVPRKAAESCEVNGYHIPKGSTLMVNVWAIARDPDEWSEPNFFRPERFLPGGEKADVDVRGNDLELIPFGAGRRICVGMNLAIRMVHLLTATLVHAFDWELPTGQTPEKLNMDEAYGITLQRVEPLMVHPKPRLAQHAYD